MRMFSDYLMLTTKSERFSKQNFTIISQNGGRS